MFCTFTTERGALILRTQDVRRLEDTPEGCMLAFVEEGHMYYITIAGTAADHLARLKAEELAAIDAARRRQARVTDGMPMVPVTRGKAR